MVRMLVMLALCIVSAAAFAAILFVFLRRLRRIDAELWGHRAQADRQGSAIRSDRPPPAEDAEHD